MANDKNPGSRTLGTRVPLSLLDRLRLESVRTKQSMQDIVVAALERTIPKNLKVVVGKEVDTGPRA